MYVPRTNNKIEFGLRTRNVESIPVWCIPNGSTKEPQMQFEDKLPYVYFFESTVWIDRVSKISLHLYIIL